jgi:cbb3-type cytochrome oxidase maturation protein
MLFFIDARKGDKMSILYLVIPLVVALLSIVAYALWWSSKKGVFNNLQGPRHWCSQRDEQMNEELRERRDA